jgi:hypothetical protein
MKAEWKKVALKAAFSLLLLAVLFWLTDVRSLARLIASAAPAYFIAAVALSFVDRLFMGWKWNVLLKAKGIGQAWGSVSRTYLTASFFSIFIPVGISGDIYRVLALGKENGAAVHVTASVILERFIGILAAVVMAVAGLVIFIFVLDVRAWFFFVVIALMLLLGTALFLLSFSRALAEALLKNRISRRFAGLAHILEKVADSYHDYQNQKGPLFLFFMLTLAEQLFPVFATYCLGLSLGFPLGMAHYFAVIPVTLILSKVPVAFNAVGIQDSLYVVLFALVGVGSPEAFAVSLLGHAAVIISTLPGGVLYMLKK